MREKVTELFERPGTLAASAFFLRGGSFKGSFLGAPLRLGVVWRFRVLNLGF